MVPNQKVKVKWNNANRKYYESKGYKFTVNGDKFEVDINDLSNGSHSLIYFICSYCLGRKQITEESKTRTYKNHMKNKTDKDCCIYCRSEMLMDTHNKRKVKVENKLSVRFPELKKQWSDKNEKSPDDYGYQSGKVVWWICEKGHEWQSKIIKRHPTGKISPCPICSALETTHPHLANEWNFIKNGSLTPNNITKGSDKKVWWIGKCGHEWESSVSHRVAGENCPYCVGKKINESNCLANLNPYLLSQWDFEKNQINPFKIALKSNKSAWWICEQGHSWNAKISSRSSGCGCPVCNESKGEKIIRNYFEDNKISFIPQYEFNDLLGLGSKPLRFDFAIINKLNSEVEMLIEYDGEFHYKKYYEEQNYETIKHHDQLKNNYCKNKNIQLLRIPYWDKGIITEILSKAISNLKIHPFCG